MTDERRVVEPTGSLASATNDIMKPLRRELLRLGVTQCAGGSEQQWTRRREAPPGSVQAQDPLWSQEIFASYKPAPLKPHHRRMSTEDLKGTPGFEPGTC